MGSIKHEVRRSSEGLEAPHRVPSRIVVHRKRQPSGCEKAVQPGGWEFAGYGYGLCAQRLDDIYDLLNQWECSGEKVNYKESHSRCRTVAWSGAIQDFHLEIVKVRRNSLIRYWLEPISTIIFEMDKLNIL